MDQSVSSVNASNASGLSGLLSSLGALLEGSAAQPGAFSHFMQQNQDSLQVATSGSNKSQSSSATNAALNAPSNTSSADAPNDGGQGKISLPTLKKILVGIHHIVEQLNQRSKTAAAPKKDQADSTPVATVAQQPVTQGQPALASAGPNSVSTPATDNSATTDTT